MKNSYFGFEFQADRNPNNKRKPAQLLDVNFHLNKKPMFFGPHYWEMLASGDVAYQSYDGVLLLLMDIFHFIHSSSYHQLTAIKEMLSEVKLNLQHLLYAVTVIFDRFPDALLQGFTSILLRVYHSVPLQGRDFVEPVKNFRLQLPLLTAALEFVIDSSHMKEPGVLETVKTKQREEEIPEFSNKQLELEEIIEFLGNCFLRYLADSKQQIYDMYYFFNSASFFEICLQLRTCFCKYGFKFQQAIIYIVDDVYKNQEIESKELSMSKVTKSIVKLIQKANPIGKKKALRGEKGMKMNARFEYLAVQADPKKGAVVEVDEAEAYFNVESIYQEIHKMKAYAGSWQLASSSSWMRSLIMQVLVYFEQSKTLINPYDLAAYISMEFSRELNDLESLKIDQLIFYNEMFDVLETSDPDSSISAHFQTFLRRLQLAGLDTIVINQIRDCASIQLETEGFRFLVNLIKHSEEFLVRITHHFLESGDELFHFTKKVFSIQTLKTLSNLIYSKSDNTSRFKLCQYFLQLITEMFSKMKDQFGNDVLIRCDKFAFHFTRRIGEYTLALYHYFGADLHNVYVV